MTNPKARQNTRNKILQAATKLFSKQGFAGTSMSKLAELANVNQSLIFHYFTDKNALWQEVKSGIINQTNVKPLNPCPKSLEEFLTEAIEQRVTIYAENPNLLRLISWQRLELANKKELKGVAHNPSTPNQWLEPIQYLQKKSKINPQLNPNLVLIWVLYSINGLIYDDLSFFENNLENKTTYLQMIIAGLNKGLSSF